MTATTDVPDLGLVAFRVDDEGDHAGGGHCVSLSQTEAEGTLELVDQYLAALSPDGRWTLTRPLALRRAPH